MIRGLIVAILFIWAGMIFGISFLEAPLKFTAPGISIKLGLGIGRIVFSALNKIELIFGVTSMLLILLKLPSKLPIFTYVGILVILLLQTLWLLPVLDDRAELILNNQPVTSSIHHIVYIGLELLKVFLLLFTGGIFLKCIKVD